MRVCERQGEGEGGGQRELVGMGLKAKDDGWGERRKGEI